MILWPLVVHAAFAALVVGGMLLASHLLGSRHRERATGEPYESGVPPTGTARARLSVHFYLVALLFVIFDLEVAFLFAYALAAKELGAFGYAAFLVFAFILTVGLVYEWRQGALDWGWSAGAQARADAAREAGRKALGRPREAYVKNVEGSA